MTKKQWVIMLSVVIGAMGGVFLGAGSDASWAALTAPSYVIGSLVAGASALGGFFSKWPDK
jgi:hypothetical protein